VQIGSATNPALIIAASQLAVVNSILRAMNGGQLPTLSVGPIAGPGSEPGACGCPPPDCSPCYLPRPVLHPTPRYLPRPVIHPTPYYPQAPFAPLPPLPPDTCHHPVTSPKITPGPQPPWKILPWQEPAKIAPKIKVVIRQPDIIRRGTLIDFFC
jgi:hypothetical protein